MLRPTTLSCAMVFLFLSGKEHVQSFQQITTVRQRPSLRPPPSTLIQNKPLARSNVFTIGVAQHSTKNEAASSSSSSSSSVFDRANQVGTSILGLILATIALYFLGSESGDLTPATSAKNVIDTALPQSATDVLAVAVAEVIGGVIGVGSTSVVAYILKSSRTYKAAASASTSLVVEAVAGADFFLTRAAAVPLLVSAGLDPVVASLLSVFIASVPYELVKDQARRSKRRQSENALLNELLQEEQDRKQRGNLSVFARAKNNSNGINRSQQQKVADVTMLKPAVPGVEFDVPELVTDIIKWLEYDVLKNNYSGEFARTGVAMSGSMESFTFGFLAALSSQLYLDAFYLNTDLGPKEKSEETRKRNGAELVSLYASSCLSTATLFAAYEGAKEPVRLGILRLLSGGIEACVGSTDFNACVFTYEFDNPVIDDVASLQAEVRALVVATASLAAQLQAELARMIDEMLRMMQTY